MKQRASRRKAGEVLGGRYRIDSYIGAGGMGEVYAATQMITGAKVALKLLFPDSVEDPEAYRRFAREARLASASQHENVVKVIDVFEDADDTPVMVMELLDGETLGARLKRVGTLSLPEALPIFRCVASALCAAHARSVVHRDLKPDNIFLVSDTSAKVLDFGIAKPLTVTTTTLDDGGETEMFGTLEYMAPEHRRREPPSRSWDVWSLAVVALEMVSGSTPMRLLLPDAGPWRPGDALKDTLPHCVSVFNRALAIDPVDRPRDAETLVREIADAMGGERRRAS